MSRNREARPPCPRCGRADRVVPIGYGLPVPDWMRQPGAEEEEDYVLGGCCITPDSPAWACRRCGEEFGRLEDERPGLFA